MAGGGKTKGMRQLLWATLGVLAAACASIGRPEGGARDETPPVFVRSDPAPGSRNVMPTKITAYFDENIQLEDAFSKVIVSPPQKTPPQVSANGHRLTAELRDTLKPNTTYTIDFADAIKDLNEGNILDGFALDFSTGPDIDTLRISGIVLQAENLEPAQGMLVGVYSNYTDTSITKVPFDRVARTNQLGQFTIRNLPEGQYRIFAVNDLNRDNHWDRSEDIAFYDDVIVPSVESIEVTDTLYSSTGADSLNVRQGIRYLPNDVLLTWFNENYKPSYLADYKRPERRKISLTFAAPQDTLPQVTIVDGAPGAGRDISEWALLQKNATLDSLVYWIADTAVVASDSLRLDVRYQKTDTLDRLVWTNDTLRFFFRDQKEKKKKKKKDDEDKPRFTVDSITGDTTFLPPPDMEYLGFSAKSGTTQELGVPLLIESSLPLATLDSAAIKLVTMVDTIWTPVVFTMRPDSVNPLQLNRIDAAWTPGGKYKLTIDSLAAVSIYGPWNRPFEHQFTLKQPEDYANLKINLPGLDSLQAVVELINNSDAVVKRAVKPAGQSFADMKLITPGKYYLRLFIDDNRNGKWDTGNMAELLQPEEVYYYSKGLNLKKNWDIEQDWDIYEVAVDAQKPYAIKKNKPKLKRGEKAPTDGFENEDEDGFGNNPFGGRDGTGGFGGSGGMGGFGPNGLRRADNSGLNAR